MLTNATSCNKIQLRIFYSSQVRLGNVSDVFYLPAIIRHHLAVLNRQFGKEKQLDSGSLNYDRNGREIQYCVTCCRLTIISF